MQNDTFALPEKCLRMRPHPHASPPNAATGNDTYKRSYKPHFTMTLNLDELKSFFSVLLTSAIIKISNCKLSEGSDRNEYVCSKFSHGRARVFEKKVIFLAYR